MFITFLKCEKDSLKIFNLIFLLKLMIFKQNIIKVALNSTYKQLLLIESHRTVLHLNLILIQPIIQQILKYFLHANLSKNKYFLYLL